MTIDDLIEDTIDPRQDQLEADPNLAHVRRFIAALAPLLATAGVRIVEVPSPFASGPRRTALAVRMYAPPIGDAA